jgi:hypothetical protein
MVGEKNMMTVTAIVDRKAHEKLRKKLFPRAFSDWLREKETQEVARNGKHR